MRTCRDCSTLVGKYKLYCEPCRIERRRVVKRGTYRRLGLRVFECAQCGSSFEATHKRKYCTKKCSSDAQQVGPRQKVCGVCGVPFTAYPAYKKYCSKKCYNESELARNRRVRYHIVKSAVERIDRVRVFTLYNWHCALCGVHTPQSKIGTYSPNAPTLDHIIPLSKRGTHTYDNVQLLCRRCNCHVKNNKISVENTLGGVKSLDSYYPETSGHRNFSARNV